VPEIKIKTTIDGKPVDAADVPVIQSDEHWNEYKLEDGTTLRVKFAVGSIIRLIGQLDPEGNPIYSVKGTVVTIPIVPDNQRKKD
jgi:hypothetical protein